MIARYDLDKIKFGVDERTWERAVELYENKRVTRFKDELSGFFAVVLGGNRYKVYVSNKHYDECDCDCYLGQNDELCKHAVAVAIYAIKRDKNLSEEERTQKNQIVPSDKKGSLAKTEISKIKKTITAAMRHIKPYNGPSRVWFSYQNSLFEGCNRLAAIFSGLPIGFESAKIIVETLLRLDDKLCRGGVDDSDGTVGGLIGESVELLQKFANTDKSCVEAFRILDGRETCFGWEEPLLKY